jgi:hypothetical protein
MQQFNEYGEIIDHDTASKSEQQSKIIPFNQHPLYPEYLSQSALPHLQHTSGNGPAVSTQPRLALILIFSGLLGLASIFALVIALIFIVQPSDDHDPRSIVVVIATPETAEDSNATNDYSEDETRGSNFDEGEDSAGDFSGTPHDGALSSSDFDSTPTNTPRPSVTPRPLSTATPEYIPPQLQAEPEYNAIRYRVIDGIDFAAVRAEPDTSDDSNLQAKLAPGTILDCDRLTDGEAIRGNAHWAHCSAEGFIHLSILNRLSGSNFTYRVIAGIDFAAVRAEPDTSDDSNLQAKLAPGTILDCDRLTDGEAIRGNARWAHCSAEGFIHLSILTRFP